VNRYADSLAALREAIKRAYVEVLEKVRERTRGASLAAIGSRRRWPPPILAVILLQRPDLQLFHGIILFVPSSISMK
jgi:hypothetical protein